MYLKDKLCVSVQVSLSIKCLFDTEYTLIHAMACCRVCDRPLPETNMAQFTNAYKRYQLSHLLTWINFNPILDNSSHLL